MPEVGPTPEQRAFLFPLVILEGSSQPELGVPGFIKEPFDAMRRLLSNPYQPGAGEVNNQAILDALTVAGTAGIGSVAAPRPTNSLGVFGGPRMRQNLEALGIDPENTQGILSKFKAQSGEVTPYVDYTGNPVIEFDFTGSEINPRILSMLSDPSYTHVHPFGNFRLGDVIDYPTLFKAMPNTQDVSVRLAKSGHPDLSEGAIGYIGNDPTITAIDIAAYDIPDFNKTFAHELNHLAQRFEGQEFGANAHNIPREFEEQVLAERARGGSIFEEDSPASYEAYMRNSSEVLSRLAEERMGMKPEERFLTHPAEMEELDIPRELQFNNAVLEVLRQHGYLPNIEEYRHLMLGL